ncbi:MAG: DivIVA domain-containing protein [Rhizobacter sp.]|nr:DivIVA domain-containing protein [Chlorobiales bacterium]
MTNNFSMRLTPIEIKKQEFKQGFRGFETEEVKAFLETIARQWEELVSENDKLQRRLNLLEDDVKQKLESAETNSGRRLSETEQTYRERLLGAEENFKRRIAELESDLQKSKQVETVMHQTIQQFQQSTSGTIENAKREAELIRKEAQIKAAQLIEQARGEVIAIGDDVQRLAMQKHEVVTKLKLLLQSQLEILSSFDTESDGYLMNQIAARRKLRVDETVENLEQSVLEKFAAPEPKETPEPQEVIPEATAAAAETVASPVELPVEPQPERVAKPSLQDVLKNIQRKPAAAAAQDMTTPEENLIAAEKKKLSLDDFQPVAVEKTETVEKTTHMEVPVDGYRTASPETTKRAMNIDDILDGLE